MQMAESTNVLFQCQLRRRAMGILPTGAGCWEQGKNERQRKTHHPFLPFPSDFLSFFLLNPLHTLTHTHIHTHICTCPILRMSCRSLNELLSTTTSQVKWPLPFFYATTPFLIPLISRSRTSQCHSFYSSQKGRA